jgi:hypothetical protein
VPYSSRAETANTCTSNYGAAITIQFVEVEACIGHRLDAGRDAVMHELVHAARLFGRHVLIEVKVLDGAAEARGERRHIKARDRANAALALECCRPNVGHGAAQGANDTEAGDYHTAFRHAGTSSAATLWPMPWTTGDHWSDHWAQDFLWRSLM